MTRHGREGAREEEETDGDGELWLVNWVGEKPLMPWQSIIPRAGDKPLTVWCK